MPEANPPRSADGGALIPSRILRSDGDDNSHEKNQSNRRSKRSGTTEQAMPRTLISLAVLVCGTFATAQQTGGIDGVVTLRRTTALEGISVSAQSDVMPRARTARTDAEGRYSLPQLLPGIYRVKIRDAGRGRAHGDRRGDAEPDNHRAGRT